MPTVQSASPLARFQSTASTLINYVPRGFAAATRAVTAPFGGAIARAGQRIGDAYTAENFASRLSRQDNLLLGMVATFGMIPFVGAVVEAALGVSLRNDHDKNPRIRFQTAAGLSAAATGATLLATGAVLTPWLFVAGALAATPLLAKEIGDAVAPRTHWGDIG